MGEIIRMRLRRKVSAAILVLDDFTDQLIRSGDLQIRALGWSGKPVRKSDGYYVFMDYPGQFLKIEVSAQCYNSKIVLVETGKLNPLRPVVKIRLAPGSNYQVPRQTTCLEGQGSPGSQIRVICQDGEKSLKLLYDYKVQRQGSPNILQLYNPEGMDLEGKLFAIASKDGGKAKDDQEWEFFEVFETLDKDKGQYLIADTLTENYKKIGTQIMPVYTTEIDQKGRYFLPIHQREAASCRCTVEMLGTKRQMQKITLETGRVNKLDFPV